MTEKITEQLNILLQVNLEKNTLMKNSRRKYIIFYCWLTNVHANKLKLVKNFKIFMEWFSFKINIKNI